MNKMKCVIKIFEISTITSAVMCTILSILYVTVYVKYSHDVCHITGVTKVQLIDTKQGMKFFNTEKYESYYNFTWKNYNNNIQANKVYAINNTSICCVSSAIYPHIFDNKYCASNIVKYICIVLMSIFVLSVIILIICCIIYKKTKQNDTKFIMF